MFARIGASPLFSGLAPRYLAELAGIAAERDFERGEMLFCEADPCMGFYILLAGRAKVFKTSPDGKEQILHVFGPGEPVGEVPVFEGSRFPANAMALTKLRTVFFPRDAFLDLVRREPDLALNMLALLSRRLRQFAHLIEDLSLKETPSRLAAYLLLRKRKPGQDEVDLDMSKTQLAALLGTIPETLSRILARMMRAGLIQPKASNRVRILDAERLEYIAEGRERLE